MTTRAGSRIFRVLVAAGLTAYLLWRSNPAAVARSAAGADLGWVSGAVLLVLLDRALMADRWIRLLCIVDQHVRPPVKRLLEIFFVSTFVGTFLPASIGGDAVRAYSLSRDRVAGGDAVASVLMDRFLGVASLLIMSVAGLALARDLAANPVVLAALAITSVACAVAVAMIFSTRAGTLVGGLLRLVPFSTLRRIGDDVVAAVRKYARFHWALASVLAGSLAVQVLRVVQAYCLGKALGIAAPLAVYFAFVPLILLVMLLPITVNGLGTSQWAFVFFFARAGVQSAPAFALSILFVGLGLVGNLPGAALYAFRGGPR